MATLILLGIFFIFSINSSTLKLRQASQKTTISYLLLFFKSFFIKKTKFLLFNCDDMAGTEDNAK